MINPTSVFTEFPSTSSTSLLDTDDTTQSTDSFAGQILASLIIIFVTTLAFKLYQYISGRLYPKKYENLTELVILNKNSNLISTDRDLGYLEKIKGNLQEAKNVSILLVGEPGSGKTTLLELLAKQINQEPKGSILKNRKIYEMDIDGLIVDSTYVGVREGRLKSFFDRVEKDKAILAIPDLNTLLPQASESLNIKPTVCDTILLTYLKRGAFSCIAKATPSTAKYNNELIDQFRKITIEKRKDKDIEQIIAQRIDMDKDTIHNALKYVKRYTPLQRNFKQHIHIFDIYKKTKDLKKAIKEVTTIPLPLNQKDNDFLLNLEKNLKLYIYGQEEAIRLVSSACMNYLQSLNDPTRPIGVFLFVGPTGTGKTELSLTIANLLFKGNCIRLNMVDFQGYMYVETFKKILSEKLLSNPFSVVLLDEVDFTESKTLAFFMTVFDAGYFTDSSGNIVDCRQALFLMTSNFQAEIIQNKKNESNYSLQKEMESLARKRFTPQFVGRMDQIIIFNPLSSEAIQALISKELEKIKHQLICFPHFFHFEWDEKAVGHLEKNYEREEGARSIQKALKFVNSEINKFVLQNNKLNNFQLTIKNGMLDIQPLQSFCPEFI